LRCALSVVQGVSIDKKTLELHEIVFEGVILSASSMSIGPVKKVLYPTDNKPDEKWEIIDVDYVDTSEPQQTTTRKNRNKQKPRP
jgi:hypothetical protein